MIKSDNLEAYPGSIIYRGKNLYYIFDRPGSRYEFIAISTSLDGKEEKKYSACSQLSDAIRLIEAMERGEEV